MGRIYKFLGLSVGIVVHGRRDSERQHELPLRHHLRHEQRVRLRLPARQHEGRRSSATSSASCNYAIVDEVDSILIDEARTPLIISGPAEQSADLYEKVDAHHPGAAQGHRLHRRREGALGDPDRRRRRADREAARRRQPLRPGQHRVAAPRARRRCGAHALQARRQLPRRGRQGHHRRRVHRPQDAGPPLVGRPAPGDRGQGRRRGRGREPDAGDDHAPELLPHLQEAGRHDRHRRHRGGGVPQDLQARRHGRSRPTSR